MLSETQQLFSLSILGWPIVLIGSTILGILWSDYSLIQHTLSVLASIVAPTRVYMNAIFVITGIMTVIYGYKLNKLLEDQFLHISTGSLIIIAGGLLISLAFFPGGVAMGVEVKTQNLHNTIASILITTFVIIPLVFINRMRIYKDRHNTLYIILIITILKIIAYLGSVVVILIDQEWSLIAGLLQRFGLLLDSIWTIYVSYKLGKWY